MVQSAVPAAVRALHDLLVDGCPWPDREPDIGFGVPAELGREMVILGPVDGTEDWAQLGARRRDCDFEIGVTVIVRWPGHDALEACDRAYALFAVIEDQLRNPGNIALAHSAGVLWNEIAHPASTPTVEDEGYGHVIQSAVRFRART